MKERMQRLADCVMQRVLDRLGWCGICAEFHSGPSRPRLSDAPTYRYTVTAVDRAGNERPL